MNVVSKSLCAIGAGAALIALTPGSAWAITPYQATASADSATCPNNQCEFIYPTVPAGMRLLVTSVSAQTDYRVVVLEGGDVSYFVANSTPTPGYLNSPVTLFYEAGQTPSARIFAYPNTGAHNSLIVTIVGELSPQ
jgi:hypothetical protein